MSSDQVYELFKDLAPQLTSYALRIVGVLIFLWLAFKVAGWAQRRITRGLEAKKFDATLSIFFGTLARWLIIIGAILACLGVFGVETTSFAAVIGAAGLAVGLAFQGTLANFASGVMLLVFRPFKIGDVVVAAGRVGTVVELGLFTTAFDTPDKRRIIIPNSEIAGKIIENITHSEERRVDIDVGVAYDADIDETRAALDRAAQSLAGRDAELGHQIFLKGLGPSSVEWQVRVWCKADVYWDLWQAAIQAIKRELDDAGLTIPFPQMDVHLTGAVDRAA